MATRNITRTLGKHQKRGVSVFAALLSSASTGELLVSGDSYELFKLPPNSLVISRDVHIRTANNCSSTAVLDVGIDGGSEFVNDANLKATAGTSGIAAPTATVTGDAETVSVAGIFVPKFYPTGGTVTAKPVFGANDVTAGECLVIIEYIEIDKATGELTEFSTTA